MLLHSSIDFLSNATVYLYDNKGKTSGPRVRFIKKGYADILIHRPHPQKELKKYVVKDLHDFLVQEGLL